MKEFGEAIEWLSHFNLPFIWLLGLAVILTGIGGYILSWICGYRSFWVAITVSIMAALLIAIGYPVCRLWASEAEETLYQNVMVIVSSILCIRDVPRRVRELSVPRQA